MGLTHTAHLAHVLGFPRIGAQRELSIAMQAFWQGQIDEAALRLTAQQLRAHHWQAQADAGLDVVSVGDFAWYDHVLGTLALLGALPARFQLQPGESVLRYHCRVARGDQEQAAMASAHWFDTDYRYLVPEWSADLRFDDGVEWLFEEVAEAQAQGHRAKVVLLGPLSLLYLGKARDGLEHPLQLLPQLLAAYVKVLARLRFQGVTLLQMDEPILGLALAPSWLDALAPVYRELAAAAPPLLLTTYFGSVSEHVELLSSLPVAGVHLDGVRGGAQLQEFAARWPQDKVLSVGLVDGRNIWRCDLDAALAVLQPLQAQLGERLWVASSCSLLHVPVDLTQEIELDGELKSWLAFAQQKLDEIVMLKQALVGHHDVLAAPFAAARAALAERHRSPRIRNGVVQQRLQTIKPEDTRRSAPFSVRSAAQQARWKLPPFPTTTVASLPQTAQIKATRAAYQDGVIGHLDYLVAMRDEIRHGLQQQQQLGLDVLVHGAPERQDSVDYFAGQLWGFGITVNGWVQRNGWDCVKPPFIYGDVYRPEPMTVGWSQFAQGLTSKPMKGMLTGPVSLLQQSFVRDDQAPATTALQIALALREEVGDLEKAGIGMIQMDEPTLHQGLPMQPQERQAYLEWAVRAFQISTAGVREETQIHSHICYPVVSAESCDILPWIAAMDADVLSVDTADSNLKLLEDCRRFDYSNAIGPGLYDTDALQMPQCDQLVQLLQRACGVIAPERLWVNPAGDLKTCTWTQASAALGQMVQAAQVLRQLQQLP